MSISQAAILRDLIEQYNLGKASTATAATTTTLTDIAMLGGQRSGGMFPNGSPIRITSGAAIGGKSWKSGLVPATGVLTYDPLITGNTGTPTYVISDKVDDIDRLIEGINRCLQRRMQFRARVPLTYLPDGDMNAPSADIATYWTASAGTASYATLAVPQVLGKRVLQITHTSGANVVSQTIPATAGEVWDFLTFIRAASDGDTAALTIEDITNSAVITPVRSEGTGATTSRDWVEQRGTFTIPATCDRIAVRLAVSGSGTMSAQMAPFVTAPQDATAYTAQAHLISNDDVGGFFAGLDLLPITDGGVTYDDRGWGVVMQWQYHPGFPIFYEEVLYYPALTSDTDTTDAPVEALLLGSAIEVYEYLVSSEMRESTRKVYMLELARLQAIWDEKRLTRQRAHRKVQIRRAYAQGVYA